MITLEYLEELGKFTLDLIENLKEKNPLPGLWQRNLYSGNIYSYNYHKDKLLFIIHKNSSLSTEEIIRINRGPDKLTFVTYNLTVYISNLEKYIDNTRTMYSTEQFKEDWFSLSTVLSDDEILEFYLGTYVQDMLLSTCSTQRILLNTSLIHVYYQSLQNKD